LVIELGHPKLLVLWIGGSSKKVSLPSFSTPFGRVIMEPPCPKKVKMQPTIYPFDGTTDADNHLDVYKAQMYI